MTVREAANKIGISQSKLYQLVAGRHIGFYRIGSKIVFSEADVDAFMQSCHVGVVAAVASSPRVRVHLKHITLR